MSGTCVQLIDSSGKAREMKSSGSTVLGREWLQVADKRLSRNQAELTVDGDTVTLKRCGVNPVKLNRVCVPCVVHSMSKITFASLRTRQRLCQKSVGYSLQDGDQLTLLADEYPFTIRISRQHRSSMTAASTTSTATDASAARAVVEELQRVPVKPQAMSRADSSKRHCHFGLNCHIADPAHALEFFHPLPTAPVDSSGTGKRARTVPGGAQGTKRPAAATSVSSAATGTSDGSLSSHAVKRAAAAVTDAAAVEAPVKAPIPATVSEDDSDPAVATTTTTTAAVTTTTTTTTTSKVNGGSVGVKGTTQMSQGRALDVPSSPVARLSSPLKRTRINDGHATDTRVRGARTLAMPLFCTSRRGVRANLPANNVARAFAASVRPFLRRHIDDRELKLAIVAVGDSDALALLESTDEPLGEPWQYQIIRVASHAAVAHAMVHMSSEMACPARFICNEATWRLHAGGAALNRAVFDAAGDNFEETVKSTHATPAEVGRAYATQLPTISPLRRDESVHYVLHAVVPVVDPDSPDCVSTEQGTGLLRQLLDDIFAKFEQVAAK